MNLKSDRQIAKHSDAGQSCSRIFVHASLFFLLIATIMACGCNDDGGDGRIFESPGTGNYTDMSWVDGFDAFHGQISKQYAFGEWKNIDWDALDSGIRPKVTQAENSNNETAYATALLEYVRSIPDGHIFASSDLWKGLEWARVAGSYGLGIIGLDDGQVIAHIVTEGGPAANAGIEAGDEILQWNGVPIASMLEQTGTMWRYDPKSLATNEHTLLEKYRMLILDPIDTQSTVTFSKYDGSGTITETMTASDDNGTIFNKTKFYGEIDFYTFEGLDINNLVQYKILHSGYGYVRVQALSGDTAPKQFKEAMQLFTDNNVPGLVIDLRGNTGGADTMAAEFSGYFYSETTVYEYVSHYNAAYGTFDYIHQEDDELCLGAEPINIEPQTPHYGGPVVVLVNPATISSGEGIAMAVQNLPRGLVVGFWGTNGSFGITGGSALLPGNYAVRFPVGRSLDKNKHIQLDSKDGVGGVTPDERIPMTSERALRYGAGEDVELEYAISVLRGM